VHTNSLEHKNLRMHSNITIRRANSSDAPAVAVMVGELLAQIMSAIGAQAFNFDLVETTSRLEDFLGRGKYFVFVAESSKAGLVGFIALYESFALYAEGTFGTIPELYVRSGYRANALGHQLIEASKSFGATRGWTRLEVTTPPLPQFERTLAFYEREDFSITGGRKLKVPL
jgi:GNAT superfamily N-acetyltransferase